MCIREFYEVYPRIYAILVQQSSICTRKSTYQVVYAYFPSKFIKLGDMTMVLAHSIECWIIYLIPSRNTISG